MAVISGGGSGHEPMHGGFVGHGMLDGACPGEIFTSPTPDQMLACGLAVNSGAGVLLIVKNYTGDVLSFETAAELLHGEGVPVQTVLVDDDVAVKDCLTPRAGAAWALRSSWRRSWARLPRRATTSTSWPTLARKVNTNSRSMGMALTSCTVPAVGRPTFTLGDDEMEIGIGIHGEPGQKRMALVTLTRSRTCWPAKSWTTAPTPAPCASGIATPANGSSAS